MELSTFEAQVNLFFFHVAVACFFGLVFGGAFTQQIYGTSLKLRFIIKRLTAWVLISLCFGGLWGYYALSDIYAINCDENRVLLRRVMPPQPIFIQKSLVSDIRLGMTGSRGDSWVLIIRLHDGINYTTASMKHKDALLVQDKIRNCISHNDEK